MQLLSWNLNGIRSAARKGLLTWLAETEPDILAVQETRIDEGALPSDLRHPLGYESSWSFPERKGYSGVATFSRERPLSVHTSLDEPRFDVEGRFVATEFERFVLFNVYFPKGSGTARDNSRVPYKLAFYDALFDHAQELSRRLGKPLIVAGDFNTAHQPIDLKNWRSNQRTSGFLPEERAKLEEHLRRGYVDTYRALHPEGEQYTWWSQRAGVRERNVGWRIDYVWVSEALLPGVTEAFILDEVRGSDHCPLGIRLSA